MNPTNFQVVRLGPDDMQLMRGLLAMFGDAFGEQETFQAAPPSNVYLENLLARDSFIALAAVIDGKAVGGLAAYVLDKYEQERSEIYIYDLAVAEPFRRRGIATTLIDTLRQIASDRGSWVIFVQADLGDDPAIALYEQMGAREDVLHFDITPAS